jgi:hypothetical protein
MDTYEAYFAREVIWKEIIYYVVDSYWHNHLRLVSF